MRNRREWIVAVTAFCAIGSPAVAMGTDQDEIIATLTAITDGSYVDQRYNRADLLYAGTYATAVRSASANSPGGQNTLGVLLILGEGVEKNPELGVSWPEKAAAQGVAEAMHNLGECYRFGLGVEKDPIKARDWLLKSLSYTSRTSLAFMYATGEGGAQDLSTAVYLFATDGDSGHFIGAYEAGLHVAIGRGVAQNLEVAWYYFEIADRDRRMPEASEAQALIETVMTTAQIRAAKRRYNRFPW